MFPYESQALMEHFSRFWARSSITVFPFDADNYNLLTTFSGI